MPMGLGTVDIFNIKSVMMYKFQEKYNQLKVANVTDLQEISRKWKLEVWPIRVIRSWRWKVLMTCNYFKFHDFILTIFYFCFIGQHFQAKSSKTVRIARILCNSTLSDSIFCKKIVIDWPLIWCTKRVYQAGITITDSTKISFDIWAYRLFS